MNKRGQTFFRVFSLNFLGEEIPAVSQAKKDLDQLIKKQHHSQSNLEKEEKRLEKLRNEEVVDHEALEAQEEKRDRSAYELENVNKDVAQEKDKLTTSLLTLVSRENRYAKSVLDLMKLRKQFYENAFRTIEAELPNIEKLLMDTQVRPVFGEDLEDHLRATRRTIAYPIALTITYLRDTDLNDEGLFRISPKQIKLDKFKAHLDSHQPIGDILLDGDVHLHSSLLKSYLRELPVPLLGGGQTYYKWMEASALRDQEKRIKKYKVRTLLNRGILYIKNTSSY